MPGPSSAPASGVTVCGLRRARATGSSRRCDRWDSGLGWRNTHFLSPLPPSPAPRQRPVPPSSPELDSGSRLPKDSVGEPAMTANPTGRAAWNPKGLNRSSKGRTGRRAAKSPNPRGPRPRSRDGLLPREAVLVRVFAKDFNVTKAAVRAGYSPRTAHVQGSQVLKRLRVRLGIAQATRTRQCHVTSDLPSPICCRDNPAQSGCVRSTLEFVLLQRVLVERLTRDVIDARFVMSLPR